MASMKQPATRRTALISSSPTHFPEARCSSPAAAAAARPEGLSTQATTEAGHTSSITTPGVTPRAALAPRADLPKGPALFRPDVRVLPEEKVRDGEQGEADQDPRQDAGDEQLRDGGVGHHAVDHEGDRRRDDDPDAAPGGHEGRRGAPVVPRRHHPRDEDRPPLRRVGGAGGGGPPREEGGQHRPPGG